MSGSIHPRFPRDRDTYYEAECDVCPWTARRHDRRLAEEAQRQHETECRPPLPDEIPDIDFPWPPCPICDGDLDNDDGWYCERCEVGWPNNGSGGEFMGDPDSADDEAPAVPAEGGGGSVSPDPRPVPAGPDLAELRRLLEKAASVPSPTGQPTGATLLLAVYLPDALTPAEPEDADVYADVLVGIVNEERHRNGDAPDVEVSAIPAPQWLTPQALARLRAAVDPGTLLALLDRIEALEAAAPQLEQVAWFTPGMADGPNVGSLSDGQISDDDEPVYRIVPGAAGPAGDPEKTP